MKIVSIKLFYIFADNQKTEQHIFPHKFSTIMNKSTFSFIFLFSFLLFSITISAAIPKMIHLQAYLEDGEGFPLNGTITLTVRIFDGEFSNNVQFTNDIADRYAVVNNGILNYYIQRLHGVDFSKELWAELTIDGTTLSQRIRLASVPYSFFSERASFADQVDTALIAKSVLPNSIKSENIQNRTITSENIANNTISSTNIRTDDNFN